jgi:hypothetical protein
MCHKDWCGRPVLRNVNRQREGASVPCVFGLFMASTISAFCRAAQGGFEREFVTGNEIPCIVAHRCIIEASIGKRIPIGSSDHRSST